MYCLKHDFGAIHKVQLWFWRWEPTSCIKEILFTWNNWKSWLSLKYFMPCSCDLSHIHWLIPSQKPSLSSRHLARLDFLAKPIKNLYSLTPVICINTSFRLKFVVFAKVCVQYADFSESFYKYFLHICYYSSITPIISFQRLFSDLWGLK